MHVRFIAAVLLAPLLATGCTPTMLAPPPAPPEQVPVIAGDTTASPAVGFTHVRLTTDVPARVYLRSDVVGYPHADMALGRHGIKTLVCETTPCAFIVPYGDHELVIEGSESKEEGALGQRTSYADRTGTTIVHAHGPEVVINESLGLQHFPAGRAVAAGMIFLGMVVAIGAAVIAKDSGASRSTTAAGVAVGGLGSIVLGGVILAAVPSVEQPAAAHEWTPKPVASAGGSLGFRF